MVRFEKQGGGVSCLSQRLGCFGRFLKMHPITWRQPIAELADPDKEVIRFDEFMLLANCLVGRKPPCVDKSIG